MTVRIYRNPNSDNVFQATLEHTLEPILFPLERKFGFESRIQIICAAVMISRCYAGFAGHAY